MSSSSSASPPDMSESPRKRRRVDIPEDEKLEIDIEAPEPASKRAKRLERKKQKKTNRLPRSTTTVTTASITSGPDDSSLSSPTSDTAPRTAQCSPHGIWIGNLPFTATKETLYAFLDQHASIPRHAITRLHLPSPSSRATSTGPRPPQNKGFAYIDFASPVHVAAALACSETLCSGRRVLIKDAGNFSGRPTPTTGAAAAVAAVAAGATPTQKVFVGNLPFHTTADDLRAHFAPAGEVVDVHVATFEDSGKCRGYGWVRFAEVEGSVGAVRGFVYVDRRADEANGEEEKEEEKEDGGAKKDGGGGGGVGVVKKRKWFLNRLQGRELRCEFAEDAQTRYRKRFGKGSSGVRDSEATMAVDAVNWVEDEENGEGKDGRVLQQKRNKRKNLDAEARRAERRKVHDARTIAPGLALANAPRKSGAIAVGEGTKIIFD